MYARSNGAHAGHFTRRTNAGQVTHYTPVLCAVVLRTGEELTGYVWLNGLMYSPDELATYLQGVRTYEPEQWDSLTLAVGMDREHVQVVGLNTIKRVRKSEQ